MHTQPLPSIDTCQHMSQSQRLCNQGLSVCSQITKTGQVGSNYGIDKHGMRTAFGMPLHMQVHTKQSFAAERMSYGISTRGDGEQQLSTCTTAAAAAEAAARAAVAAAAAAARSRRRKRRRRERRKIKYMFLMTSQD